MKSSLQKESQTTSRTIDVNSQDKIKKPAFNFAVGSIFSSVNVIKSDNTRQQTKMYSNFDGETTPKKSSPGLSTGLHTLEKIDTNTASIENLLAINTFDSVEADEDNVDSRTLSSESPLLDNSTKNRLRIKILSPVALARKIGRDRSRFKNKSPHNQNGKNQNLQYVPLIPSVRLRMKKVCHAGFKQNNLLGRSFRQKKLENGRRTGFSEMLRSIELAPSTEAEFRLIEVDSHDKKLDQSVINSEKAEKVNRPAISALKISKRDTYLSKRATKKKSRAEKEVESKDSTKRLENSSEDWSTFDNDDANISHPPASTQSANTSVNNNPKKMDKTENQPRKLTIPLGEMAVAATTENSISSNNKKRPGTLLTISTRNDSTTPTAGSNVQKDDPPGDKDSTNLKKSRQPTPNYRGFPTDNGENIFSTPDNSSLKAASSPRLSLRMQNQHTHEPDTHPTKSISPTKISLDHGREGDQSNNDDMSRPKTPRQPTPSYRDHLTDNHENNTPVLKNSSLKTPSSPRLALSPRLSLRLQKQQLCEPFSEKSRPEENEDPSENQENKHPVIEKSSSKTFSSPRLSFRLQKHQICEPFSEKFRPEGKNTTRSEKLSLVLKREELKAKSRLTGEKSPRNAISALDDLSSKRENKPDESILQNSTRVGWSSSNMASTHTTSDKVERHIDVFSSKNSEHDENHSPPSFENQPADFVHSPKFDFPHEDNTSFNDLNVSRIYSGLGILSHQQVPSPRSSPMVCPPSPSFDPQVTPRRESLRHRYLDPDRVFSSPAQNSPGPPSMEEINMSFGISRLV